MKRIFVLVLTLSVVYCANAQSFAYRGGRYNGVYGMVSNPANIGGNDRKWDVNLFSISAAIATDKVALNKETKLDKIKDELFSGKGKALSGLLNVDVLGPSFFFRISPKHSIGFSTRARVFANIGALDTKLAETLREFKNKQSLPYDISSGNQSITLNAWSEMNASWGGVVFQKAEHKIKAGATLKYLRGAGNTFVYIKDLKGTINANLSGGQNAEVKPYLTNTTGELYLVSSGLDLLDKDFNKNKLKDANGKGFGFDLGVTYEFKGNTTDSILPNISKNDYKVKVGIALLDVGAIKYKSSDNTAIHYTFDVPKGKKMDISGIPGSVEGMKEYFDKSPYATKEAIAENYNPSLPTTLNMLVDYLWGNGLFTEVSARFSLVDKDNKVENPYYYNGFTFTPRFENKYIGVYLPMDYNDLSKFNAGITLRLGPVIVGSGSIISTAFSEGKQADVFFGFRFGI